MKCRCGGTVTYQGLVSVECDNAGCDNYDGRSGTKTGPELPDSPFMKALEAELDKLLDGMFRVQLAGNTGPSCVYCLDGLEGPRMPNGDPVPCPGWVCLACGTSYDVQPSDSGDDPR